MRLIALLPTLTAFFAVGVLVGIGLSQIWGIVAILVLVVIVCLLLFVALTENLFRPR